MSDLSKGACIPDLSTQALDGWSISIVSPDPWFSRVMAKQCLKAEKRVSDFKTQLSNLVMLERDIQDHGFTKENEFHLHEITFDMQSILEDTPPEE